MSLPKISLKLPTSTPKESRVSNEGARARDYNESTVLTPLDREMDSMKLEDIEKEFGELTAQYNRLNKSLIEIEPHGACWMKPI
jgi:hypothetical protein